MRCQSVGDFTSFQISWLYSSINAECVLASARNITIFEPELFSPYVKRDGHGVDLLYEKTRERIF